jgi:hypothetical protein
MRRKKILYFDYWTIGIKNFKLFDEHLKAHGFETKLIHLNSWRRIEGPIHEIIEGIECYDVKYYDTIYLHDILKKENPVAVVMLNASFVTDRTIILSCKKLGIRCVYLMHGALTREEFIDENIKSINHNMKWVKFKRGAHHLKRTALNYLNSAFKYNNGILTFHPYKVLFNTLMNPGTYLHFPPPAFDLRPDLTLVYGLSDYKFYTKRFQLPEESVKIVGNPDLDQYFRLIGYLGQDKGSFLESHHIPNDKPYITYIEEGLAEDQLWENEYRIQFLQEIGVVCKEAGYHLVIKLHPRTARGPYFNTFSRLKDVTILTNVNFPRLVYFSDKCVSHYSTTLIYPMLLNKPILVPRWAQSAEVFNLYSEKEVTFVPTLKKFKSLIRQHNFNYDRSEYINNIVPFQDGKTAERIANNIIALVQ